MTGTNYGKLDMDGLQTKRSWMIGLSAHGLSAIRSVDGLYENYVRGLGVDINKAFICIGSKIRIERDAKTILGDDSAFTVDRNFICAALARYLNEKYEDNHDMKSVHVRSPEGKEIAMPEFVSQYHTRALYVDYDKKRVMVRELDGDDKFLDYDLIIGCDGIRSVVRNAIVNTNRDFEFSINSTFGKGKGFHVDMPPDMDEGSFFFIMNAIPNMTSFTLPETGRKLNVNLGFSMNSEDDIDPVMKSNDASAISAYLKKHFHAFKIDCDDAARQWVEQGWNTISQVHCNIYHDSRRMILLMGDAAHATSPQIGQGMNTALADAAAFDEILDSHKDDLEASLDTFSKDRVKEGNALTDLSFYTLSLSPSQQMGAMIESILRASLHRLLPMIFDPFPMDEIPRGGKLSVAYDKMNKLGIIPKIRATNDAIMRDYFERQCGMVTTPKKSFLKLGNIVGLGVLAAAAMLGYRQHGSFGSDLV